MQFHLIWNWKMLFFTDLTINLEFFYKWKTSKFQARISNLYFSLNNLSSEDILPATNTGKKLRSITFLKVFKSILKNFKHNFKSTHKNFTLQRKKHSLECLLPPGPPSIPEIEILKTEIFKYKLNSY